MANSLLRAIALLAATMSVLPAIAVEAFMTTTITRTMTLDDDQFGGCMVRLADSPASVGLQCPAHHWVTLSCVGEHTSKSAALRLFDSAQLAFLTNKRVKIRVDDSRTHDGACFASRIDVLAD